MLNYLKKFALDVVPSVVATILGAYIVNHYITAKSSADIPHATVASTSEAGKKSEAKKAQVKPAETSAEVTSVPEPGVKARGISERAMIENRAAERPAEVKPADVRPTDIAKPAETASIPAESKSEIKRPQTPAPREKALAKVAPAQTTAPAPTTVPAAVPATESASASDEPRDANELALEAIKRLRANGESAPRVQETSRQAEPPRVQEPPRTSVVVPVVTAPAPVRPLPPPIVVATPSPTDNAAQGPGPTSPPYTASIDPNRPTPPADIPSPRPPVDLKNEATNAVTHTKNVAEDVLAAAKSMFHAVLPGTDRQSSSASQFTD
jgi:hypothetical protein